MAFVLNTIMDGIATAAATVTPRAHGYPIQNPSPPCMIVGYPTRLDYDFTFKNGAIEATFPLWYVVSDVYDKGARDALTPIISGAVSIKNQIEANLQGVAGVQSCRVVDMKVETIQIGTVEYLAAHFDLDVIG